MTLEAFETHRCSAILRTPNVAAAAPAMHAAIDGGFRIIEFTLNTPDALEHIAAFAASGELTVGAGTVLTTSEAKAAADAGAKFIVSPVTDAEVIRYTKDLGLLSIPGAATPTEALTAHRAGADLVKIFPGPSGDASWVRAVRGPLPFLKLFPTSGVTLENVADFLDAGAFGVGFVNCLFEPADLDAGNFDAVLERAKAMVAAVQRATA